MNPTTQPRRVRLRVALRALLVVAGLVAVAWAPAPASWREPSADVCAPAPHASRVLFVGNSLTYYYDLPGLVTCLTSPDGEGATLAVESVVRGGATLAEHWLEGRALERIRAGRFDVVVLQEQSLEAANAPEASRRALGAFVGAVRAAGAQPVLYLPWQRTDAQASRSRVALDALASWGDALGVRVARVGPAFERAESTIPGVVLRDPDGSHPSLEGSYLAAAVFVVTLGGSPHPRARTFRRYDRVIDWVLPRVTAEIAEPRARALVEVARHAGGSQVR